MDISNIQRFMPMYHGNPLPEKNTKNVMLVNIALEHGHCTYSGTMREYFTNENKYR